MLKKIRHFKQYNAKNLLLKELENLSKWRKNNNNNKSINFI